MTDHRPEVWELLKESRRGHYYCEDSWYSCPLAEGGCADARQPKAKCNCGASEWNARVEAALAAPPIEPVGMREALEMLRWALSNLRHNEYDHDYVIDEGREMCDFCKKIKQAHAALQPERGK